MRRLTPLLAMIVILGIAGCSKKNEAKKNDTSGAKKEVTPPKTEEAPSPPKTVEAPPVAAKPTAEDCNKLQAHIFELPNGDELKEMKPEEKQKTIDEFVKAVPPEDLEQCQGGEKKVIDCMLAAASMDALQACIPQ
jgi:uncharacterized lipoprotein